MGRMRTLRQFNQATPPNPLTPCMSCRLHNLWLSENAVETPRHEPEKKHAIKNNKIKLIIMRRRQRQREGQRRGSDCDRGSSSSCSAEGAGGWEGGIVSPGCRIEIAYLKPETISTAFFIFFYFLAAFKKFVAIASTCATFKEPSGK